MMGERWPEVVSRLYDWQHGWTVFCRLQKIKGEDEGKASKTAKAIAEAPKW